MTGINIKCRFGGGSIIRFSKVTVRGEAGEVDETDSESGGYVEMDENGFVVSTVTFEGWLRSADGAPIAENMLLTNVYICWDGNVAVPVVNKRHFYPKLKITTVEFTGGAKDGSVRYIGTGKSSGIYYPPGIS